MFPKCKNSQKRVKNQKSTDKHSSFDGLIQEDIYLAVHIEQIIFNQAFPIQGKASGMDWTLHTDL
jgi:hypothetical protein